VRHRVNLSSDLEPFTAPARLLSDRDTLNLTAWLLSTRIDGPRGHSIPTPIWRALRLRAVGKPISGHDVSGPASQTVGRAMQPITTIMPLLQCGHWRRDRPVSAS
jgi:hypothetical protein